MEGETKIAGLKVFIHSAITTTTPFSLIMLASQLCFLVFFFCFFAAYKLFRKDITKLLCDQNKMGKEVHFPSKFALQKVISNPYILLFRFLLESLMAYAGNFVVLP